MTNPPVHRIERNARNDEEIHAVLNQATGKQGQPAAGGTSYHDGVAAAIRWMHGDRHPFAQPPVDVNAGLTPEQRESQPGQRTAPDAGTPPTPGVNPAAGTGAPGGTGTTAAPTTGAAGTGRA
jgi:hypothetical protein